MSTAQLTKQSLPNATESMVFVRNMIRTTISSICYLRSIFPENCFTDCSFSGLNVKFLKANDEQSTLLTSWIDGLFEAIEKRYLSMMTFAIYADEACEEDLVECYSFAFQYKDEHVQLTLNSKTIQCTRDSIRKATLSVLRNIITLSQTLDPMPDERFVTIMLNYTPETPADYEPKHFQSAPFGHPIAANQPVKLVLGGIETPILGLKLRVRTSARRFSGVDTTTEAIEEFEAMNQSPPSTNPALDQLTSNAFHALTSYLESHTTRNIQALRLQFPILTEAQIGEVVREKHTEPPIHPSWSQPTALSASYVPSQEALGDTPTPPAKTEKDEEIAKVIEESQNIMTQSLYFLSKRKGRFVKKELMTGLKLTRSIADALVSGLVAKGALVSSLSSNRKTINVEKVKELLEEQSQALERKKRPFPLSLASSQDPQAHKYSVTEDKIHQRNHVGHITKRRIVS